MTYQKPKGTADILPGSTEKWQYIETTARKLFANYQVTEIRTPLFEHYEVIARSVGDTTDIVAKEMYDFYDKGKRHVTLRPEGTAPVVRSYVENKLYGPEFPKPYKVYYCGPMFRYERPQSGRLRQFHQIGVEVLGSENPAVDVETIAMALDFYKKLGLKYFTLVLNSLGDKASRAAHREALLAYLVPIADQMSSDSKARLVKNPLRILDSKAPEDQEIVANAPSILSYLNEESSAYFETVKKMLAVLQIPYVVDATMVRGLDYYNHTIFEIMSNAPGFGGTATTICAGGRYNGLVEELGGPATPSFGFGMGIERVLITLEAENIEIPAPKKIDIYVACANDTAELAVLKLVQSLREQDFSVERDYLRRKLKAQLKTANKQNANYLLVIGETEIAMQAAILKKMTTGEEIPVSFAELTTQAKKILS